MDSSLNEFSRKVIQTVRQIPRGKVATYKQIAGLCSKPHASRGVAWILNACSEKYKLPWHRVLSSKGRISFKPLTHAHRLQKRQLEREGVEFLDEENIDMAKYQWRRQPRVPRRRRNQPRLFS